MNIKVLVDYEVIDDYKNDKVSFDRNIDLLKKISSLHDVYLFATSKFLESPVHFELKDIFKEIITDSFDRNSYVNEVKTQCDWILYFKMGVTTDSQNDNIVYCPIKFIIDTTSFKNVSFTELARNKKYYHDFSNYYMYTLGNDTEKEAEFLSKVFKKNVKKESGNLVDLWCGVGRHAYLLAKNGYRVTGIDFSQDQIENARKIHNHELVDYAVMDVRNITLPKRYDMSYCMWTTYNYLSQEEDLKKFIISNYNHQNKGDILVLDSKNIPRLDSHRLYNRIREDGNFKMEILINKYVTDNIQNSQYLLFINDNKEKKFFLDEELVRFYTIDELNRLMKGYYELVDIYGDFDMNKYDEKTSNRFITMFRRL